MDHIFQILDWAACSEVLSMSLLCLEGCDLRSASGWQDRKLNTRKQNDKKKFQFIRNIRKKKKRKEISLLPKHSPPPFVKHFRKPGQISPFNAHVQEGVKEQNTHCKKELENFPHTSEMEETCHW